MILADFASAFAVGAFGFFAVIGILTVLFVVAAASDTAGMATLWLVLLAAFLFFIAGVDWPSVLWSRPWLTLAIIAIYLPVGVAWAFFRWARYLDAAADELAESKDKFPANSTFGGYGTWEAYVDRIMPTARNNKSRIVNWMGYWPVSATWYLLNDFIRDLFNKLYAKFAGRFERMADTAKARLKQ